jgi:serine/threonine-protein kinase RsbW
MISSQTRKTTRKSSPNANSLATPVTKPPRTAKAKTMPRPSPTVALGESGDEQVEIRIPADARWVRMVRLAAAGVASVLNFSVDEIDDIKSAVAEACNNAILHAQPAKNSDQLPMVIVTMIPAHDYLEIRVEDEGRVAEGIAMPLPKAHSVDAEVLPVGGLGLLFIEAMMDEVRLHSGPNTNTTLSMVKKRRSLG